MGAVSQEIAAYAAARPEHASGSVSMAVIEALEALLSPGVRRSVETGCGKSSILFSRLSREHFIFTVDDSASESGSLPYARDCPAYRAGSVVEVLGPTQLTLKNYRFPGPLDMVFLDGPHGYPAPELEYFYLYPGIVPGGLLIVDDIHIPTIYRLYEFLREDEMWQEIEVVEHTACFRRTEAPTFPPDQDLWFKQQFNVKRFPVAHSAGRRVEE